MVENWTPEIRNPNDKVRTMGLHIGVEKHTDHNRKKYIYIKRIAPVVYVMMAYSLLKHLRRILWTWSERRLRSCNLLPPDSNMDAAKVGWNRVWNRWASPTCTFDNEAAAFAKASLLTHRTRDAVLVAGMITLLSASWCMLRTCLRAALFLSSVTGRTPGFSS